MARRAQGRLVTAVNGGVAVALVVLLAVVALVVKPPSPPGIAEFAPQATKPITKAPPGQAAQHGTGPGACVTGQTCEVVAPSKSAKPLPSVSLPPREATTVQCYQWPDGTVTQTFDPQSPPCIASWPERAKGNGGETTRGVTATEIQITMSKSTLSNGTTAVGTMDTFEPYVRHLLDFFNSSYQLYDRKLRLVVNYADRGDTASKAHSAAQAALDTEAFAAVFGLADDGSMSHELAEAKMVSVNFGTASNATSKTLAADAPYSWSYEPPVDTTQRNLAAFVCTSLKGKKARFSDETQALTRKFVIHNSWSTVGNERSTETDATPLKRGLKACGLDVGVVTTQDTDAVTYAQTGQQAATDMRNRGVTTVLSLESCCNQQFESYANQVNWHPEWVYFGKDRQYTSVAQQDKQNGQATNRIGLAPTNKLVSKFEEPYFRAAPDRLKWREFYTSLQIIAAGVQMAGPQLTPESFGNGLFSARFPNPYAGTKPYYQAAIGFSADEPWAIHDFAVWWPDTTTAPDARTANYPLCFVGQGARWRLGTWVDLEKRIKGGPRGC